MSAPSRWRFAVLPIVLLAITLPDVVRNHVDVAAMWPQWRVAILSSLLVLAGAVLVAAVAAAFVAWQRAKLDGAAR